MSSTFINHAVSIQYEFTKTENGLLIIFSANLLPWCYI